MLGLATGSSPMGIYAELARRVAVGELELCGVTGFALDEYVGLPAGASGVLPPVLERGRPAAGLTRGAGARRPGRRPRGRGRRLRAGHRRGRRHRSATAGHRRRRAHRLQRADVVASPRGPASRLWHRATRRTTRGSSTAVGGADALLTQGLGTILEARELLLVAHGEARPMPSRPRSRDRWRRSARRRRCSCIGRRRCWSTGGRHPALAGGLLPLDLRRQARLAAALDPAAGRPDVPDGPVPSRTTTSAAKPGAMRPRRSSSPTPGRGGGQRGDRLDRRQAGGDRGPQRSVLGERGPGEQTSLPSVAPRPGRRRPARPAGTRRPRRRQPPSRR